MAEARTPRISDKKISFPDIPKEDEKLKQKDSKTSQKSDKSDSKKEPKSDSKKSTESRRDSKTDSRRESKTDSKKDARRDSKTSQKSSSSRNSYLIDSPRGSKEEPPGPKSSKLHPEGLFLLEFLLEKLMVYPKSLPSKLREEHGGVSVTMFFFDNDPLEICHEQFDPYFGCPNPYNRARSGRSLLFALEPKIINDIIKNFILNLEVFKVVESKEEGKVKIGEACIDVSPEFSEVINRTHREGTKNPITKIQIYNTSIQGTLANAGCCIGEINLLLRISCLGKTIVTQIHFNKDDDSVMFADDNMTSMYKFSDKTGGSGCKPCQPPKPCNYLPPCGIPPCNFPSGFALCGPNPVCPPICGMPPGSRLCYVPPYCYANPCSYYPCLLEMNRQGQMNKIIIPTKYKPSLTAGKPKRKNKKKKK